MEAQLPLVLPIGSNAFVVLLSCSIVEGVLLAHRRRAQGEIVGGLLLAAAAVTS